MKTGLVIEQETSALVIPGMLFLFLDAINTMYKQTIVEVPLSKTLTHFLLSLM